MENLDVNAIILAVLVIVKSMGELEAWRLIILCVVVLLIVFMLTHRHDVKEIVYKRGSPRRRAARSRGAKKKTRKAKRRKKSQR